MPVLPPLLFAGLAPDLLGVAAVLLVLLAVVVLVVDPALLDRTVLGCGWVLLCAGGTGVVPLEPRRLSGVREGVACGAEVPAATSGGGEACCCFTSGGGVPICAGVGRWLAGAEGITNDDDALPSRLRATTAGVGRLGYSDEGVTGERSKLMPLGVGVSND